MLKSKKIKGLILTFKSLGSTVALRETARRVFGLEYDINGVKIRDHATFRTIRDLMASGLRVEFTQGEVVVYTRFGVFKVAKEHIALLSAILEDLDEMYGSLDYRDKLVVDIGAYIGDTASYFLSRGARRVYAFEPVPLHYRYLLENIEINQAGDRITARQEGVWFRDGSLSLLYDFSSTGLDRGRQEILVKVRPLDSILGEIMDREGCIDIVKMDCEGCEYVLLVSNPEVFARIKQYVIEIHGSPWMIIDWMKKNGYKVDKIINLERLINIVYFTKSQSLGMHE